MQSLDLEKLKFHIIMSIPQEMVGVNIQDIATSVHTSFIADELMIRLRAFVLGQKVDEINVKYPADWKQAVKERFAPTWFLRRWPVVYTERHIKVEAVYPTLKYAIPGHEAKIWIREWGYYDR